MCLMTDKPQLLYPKLWRKILEVFLILDAMRCRRPASASDEAANVIIAASNSDAASPPFIIKHIEQSLERVR
jgi:hypothetical protein